MARGILIQPSFYVAMKVLPDNDRLLLYDTICEYSLNGVAPSNLPPIANSLFILMKPNIDSANNRYSASVENGKKGGAPKGNQNARKKQPKNNQTIQPNNNQDSDLDYDTDLDIDSAIGVDKAPTRYKFFPPTVDEVKKYCQEQGLAVDAERFVDHYESNGWMVGKNKMKDWQAAVRNWSRKEKPNNGKTELQPIWNNIGTTV